MERVHVIRHKVLVEGKSAREVARELSVSRNTVAKYLEQAEPMRRKLKPRGRPVLERAGARIEELLEEWRGRTTAKQRITGTRVYRELVEAGEQVGITTVRQYLRERRRREAEVFIPLVHRPGDEAQVDFFTVTVDEGGERRDVWKFLMRLMYAPRDFAWLYDQCDQLSFLDGHVRAFEHFGGVPARIVYDNLSAAVKRRAGLDRELTDRFHALASHYLFEPCFARPGEGHDKGGVESRGKGIRLQHLTPIPKGERLAEIATRLLDDLDAATERRRDPQGRSAKERFAEELAVLRPLPTRPFDPRRVELVTINRHSLARVSGCDYSLPSHWSQLEATAHVGVDDIRFVCYGEEVTKRRSREKRSVEYRDYLRELARKPQAVRQVAPELLSELGEPYERLWNLLVSRHDEREAARVLARIAGCLHAKGETAVTEVLRQAFEGSAGAAAREGEQIQTVNVPERLREYEITSARAADYDVLLAGGGR